MPLNWCWGSPACGPMAPTPLAIQSLPAMVRFRLVATVLLVKSAVRLAVLSRS